LESSSCTKHSRISKVRLSHPQCTPLVQHDDLLGATAAALAAGFFYDLNLVVLLGAGSSAFGTSFCLDLESCRIVFLIVSVSFRDESFGIAYLEESNYLAKFLGIEVVFEPLLQWKRGRLARNDLESPKCSWNVFSMTQGSGESFLTDRQSSI
jgi:hypothetical protein